MAKARSPWRALRPVLLAGAATLTWLTFSSPAASADVLSDTTSLVGDVTSSVSSVTDKLAGSAGAATAAPPAAAPSTGLLQPVVGQLSGLADNIVAAVPVVNQVVPAGTVTAVSAPVAGVADGATAAVVDVVVPPVAEAVPVLEPVLQPVSDLVTGTAPLPVEVPELPVAPVDADSSERAVVPTDDHAADGDPDATSVSRTPADVPIADAVGGPGFAASPAGRVAPAGTSSILWASLAAFGTEAASGLAGEQQDSADPSPVPAQAPAAPGSGTGSGTSMSGSSGSAAWLSPFTFDLPVAGAVRAGETSEHIPAPVSFDPGSSPD
ncbi:hypothetical protein [Arthrobacter sp. D3-16]